MRDRLPMTVLTLIAVAAMAMRGTAAEEAPPQPVKPSVKVPHADHDHSKSSAHDAVAKPGEAHDGGHAKGDDGHAHEAHDHHAPKLRGATPFGPFGPGKEFKGTEFMAVDLPLLAWTLLLFVPLFYFLKFFVWSPVLHAMHHREHSISESLRQAEEAKAEAARMIAEHHEWVAQSHRQAKDLLEKTRAEATTAADALLASARAKAEESQKAARAEIAIARDEALGQIDAVAASLSASIAATVIGRTVPAIATTTAVGKENA